MSEAVGAEGKDVPKVERPCGIDEIADIDGNAGRSSIRRPGHRDGEKDEKGHQQREKEARRRCHGS
ncbi:hypothetical protein D3C84_1246980 [compost metagenome]